MELSEIVIKSIGKSMKKHPSKRTFQAIRIFVNKELEVLEEALDKAINLLKDLQEKFSLTYLFISHNLGVVEYIADRIAVMYRGNLVELGTTEQIMKNPQHVYTKRLLNSMPIIDPVRARKMFEEFEVSAEEIVITGTEKFEEVEEGHFVLK